MVARTEAPAPSDREREARGRRAAGAWWVATVVASLVLTGCVVDAPDESAAPPDEDAALRPIVSPTVSPHAGASGGARGPDVHVTVDAARGPHGASPTAIDREFYGMNIADWQPQDYIPDPHDGFASYLRALEPGVLRWPAGHTSQSLVWEGDPRADEAESVLTAEDVGAFMQLAETVGADPLLAVNQKTGTPEGAADLVRHVNVEKGHDVRWWQIGNEPDHLDGLTEDPEEYARDFLVFAEAMREVDPSIRLVGGEIMTGAHILGTNGAEDWITPILEIAGHSMDAISWHYYPLDSNQERANSSATPSRENLFQESALDWRPAGLTFADELFPNLTRLRDEHAPGAEIWVTEIAEDSADGGQEGLVGTMAGALWTADALGRFAAHSPDALVKFVFKSGSDHRFTLLDEDYEPRPAYYVYWLYARHFGEGVTSAQSSAIEEVAAHAALRDDRALTVVLVNKMDEPRTVALDVNGHEASDARVMVVAGSSYTATAASVNGQLLTPDNVEGDSAPTPVSFDLGGSVTVPPFSVTLLELRE